MDQKRFIIENITDILIELKSLRAEVKALRKENNDLCAGNIALRKENESLKKRLNQNSTNSSKPPSSDAPWIRVARKSVTKGRSNRKPGGQMGHKGYKLNKFEKVDHYLDHKMDNCPHCYSKQIKESGCRKRQVVDIPPSTIEVTEHSFYAYQCTSCGQSFDNEQIKDYRQEVQYGERLKALVVYLNVYQLIPYKRLVELIEAMYGHRISQGSISNFCNQTSLNLKGFVEQLKAYFIGDQKVVHSDETGIVVGKNMYWTHVYSDAQKTLLIPHANRGRKAMEDIGILPQAKGTIIHDRFIPYLSYKNFTHGLCNAHLLRDIKAAYQSSSLDWLQQIKAILLKAKQYKDLGKLTPRRISKYQKEYEYILCKQRKQYKDRDIEWKQKNVRGKPQRTKDHNLHIAMWKHRNDILGFMHSKEIPFDNNQAERDLRMLKVKMKVSNLFQSHHWAEVHLTIRSYISTIKKNNGNILNSLKDIQNNPNSARFLAV